MAQNSQEGTFIVYQLVDHGNTLLKNLHAQWKQAEYCDLVIDAQGQMLQAHACVLSSFSSRIACIISKQRLKADKLARYKLEVKFDYTVMESILAALYTGVFQTPLKQFQDVYTAAQWLQITELVDALKTYGNDLEMRMSPVSDEHFNSVETAGDSTLSDTSGSAIKKPDELLNSKTDLVIRIPRIDDVLERMSGMDRNNSHFVQSQKATKLPWVKDEVICRAIVEIKEEHNYFNDLQFDDNCEQAVETSSFVSSDSKKESILEDSDEVMAENTNSFVKENVIADSKTLTCQISNREHVRRNRRLPSRYIEMTSDKEQTVTGSSQAVTESVVKQKLDSVVIEEILDDDPVKNQVDDLMANESFDCDLCRQKFASLDLYNAHMQQHQSYNCHLCSRSFTTVITRHRHILIDHFGNNHLVCCYCGFRANTQIDLRAHCADVHDDAKPFHCSFRDCVAKFEKHGDLLKHMNAHSVAKEAIHDKSGTSHQHNSNADSNATKANNSKQKIPRKKSFYGKFKQRTVELKNMMSIQISDQQRDVGGHSSDQQRDVVEHSSDQQGGIGECSSDQQRVVGGHSSDQQGGVGEHTSYQHTIMETSDVLDDDPVKNQVDDLMADESFDCDLCHQKFASLDLYNTHMQQHQSYNCHLCSRSFTTVITRHRHILIDHFGNNHLVCCYCGFRAKTQIDLRAHCADVHNDDKPFHCSFRDCVARFEKHGDLLKHMNAHSGTKEGIHSKSGASHQHNSNADSNATKANNGIQKIPRKKSFYKKFKQRTVELKNTTSIQISDQQRGVGKHSSDQQGDVGEHSTDQHTTMETSDQHVASLVEHDQTEPGGEAEKIVESPMLAEIHSGGVVDVELSLTSDKNGSIKCFKCYEKFSDLEEFNQHMHSHPIYDCNRCTMSFTSKLVLTRHIREDHIGLAHLICRHCRFRAESQVQLRKHCADAHKDGTPFSCSHEGCRFTTKKHSYLRKHMIIHKVNKEFMCDKCSMSFLRESGLVLHQGSCRQLREFLCDLCGQTFNRKQCLRKHLQVIHSGEKRYNCSKCSQSFGDHRNLHRHMLIHSGSFPYSCQVCQQKFRHSNSLKSHIATKHCGHSENSSR